MMAAMARRLREILAYFEGVLGADAYRKYLEHHAASGHIGEPMSEREFWRDRTDRQDARPEGRCC